MANIQISLAIGDYDHVRDLALGQVQAGGVDITYLNLPVEEIFYRFTKFREWDVSEMSFGKYVSLISQNDATITAIPVFPSRVFRLSSLYVRRAGRVRGPRDLAGKRVGIPEWAQSAAIYTRGYIAHELGIPLNEIDWYQAGVNEPGRVEKVALQLPEGVRYASVADRSLSEMLLSGDLDVVMSARPPTPFTQGHADVVRLFPDYREVEEAYWRKTRIFPIMHIVALRCELLERNPWLAMNLLKGFEEAKRRSLARATDITASHYPLPWGFDYAARCREMFGADFWPYGIEPNRITLEAFLQFAHEQGVCHRRVTVEELFPAEVLSRFRV